MTVQERILQFVKRANWVLWGIITVAGFMFASQRFASGLLVGGLIVTVNFHMLARTLRRALTPPHLASHHSVIAKYYLRFIISGILIFLLIVGRVVDPVGLILGLSVVVVSIILATVMEIKHLLSKEAV